MIDAVAGPLLTEASTRAIDATQPILDTYKAVVGILNVVTIDIGSVLTLGVAGLLFALASLRTSVVPRWIG